MKYAKALVILHDYVQFWKNIPMFQEIYTVIFVLLQCIIHSSVEPLMHWYNDWIDHLIEWMKLQGAEEEEWEEAELEEEDQ